MYKPAIGNICKTLLAVRNMSMSFFNNRFTVFGKSEENFISVYQLQIVRNNIPLMLGCLGSTFGGTLLGDLFLFAAGAFSLAVGNFFGNANMPNEATINNPAIKTKPVIFQITL